MIHTLALWPGTAPKDAGAACREYSRRMIAHSITVHRTGTLPDRDPQVMTFCREAGLLLLADPAQPLQMPEEVAMVCGEVLTIDLDGPQPSALALLARLAEDHDLVLFDLLAHRLLTTADISTTFGQPTIATPAQPGVLELIGHCSQRWECVVDSQVLLDSSLACFRRLDPFAVVPIQDELEQFQMVLDLLGCYDLYELKERLDGLLFATEDAAVR